MDWLYRTRAVLFLLVGFSGVIAAAADLASQYGDWLWAGRWHFESVGEFVLRSAKSGDHLHPPAFLFYMPMWILYAVVGIALMRQGIRGLIPSRAELG